MGNQAMEMKKMSKPFPVIPERILCHMKQQLSRLRCWLEGECTVVDFVCSSEKEKVEKCSLFIPIAKRCWVEKVSCFNSNVNLFILFCFFSWIRRKSQEWNFILNVLDCLTYLIDEISKHQKVKKGKLWKFWVSGRRKVFEFFTEFTSTPMQQ